MNNKEALEFAAISGNIDMLVWLEEQQPPMYPDIYTVVGAVYYGHLHILEWLASPPPESSRPAVFVTSDNGAAMYAAAAGRVEVLEWLASPPAGSARPAVVFDVAAANTMAAEGHVHALQWLASPPPGSGRNPVFCDEDGAKTANSLGQVDVVAWLEQERARG